MVTTKQRRGSRGRSGETATKAEKRTQKPFGPLVREEQRFEDYQQ